MGERTKLKDHFEKQSDNEVNDYRILKNSFSIDGLPSIGHRVLNDQAPVVAKRYKAGFWMGYKDATALERLQSFFQFYWSRDLAMLSLGGLLALCSMKGLQALKQS